MLMFWLLMMLCCCLGFDIYLLNKQYAPDVCGCNVVCMFCYFAFRYWEVVDTMYRVSVTVSCSNDHVVRRICSRCQTTSHLATQECRDFVLRGTDVLLMYY